MAKPLSTDLRDRLIEAVNSGASGHAAADRFLVVPSTVSKLMKRFREAGTSAPRRISRDELVAISDRYKQVSGSAKAALQPRP
jgi:transposase